MAIDDTEAMDATSEAFFREVVNSRVLPTGISPVTAATTVLCNLLHRVSGGESEDFVRASPPVLRKRLTLCIEGHKERPRIFDRETFLQYVAEELGLDADAAARVSRAVFAAVQARLPREAVDDVEAQLPRDLATLWRRPAEPVDAFVP